ncbi:hypothetical protein CPC08DRAFT_709051 [Agrocybe pediades]|nr:hypothetical protein CPC08DRAFT_709051 [Agrocybe pediades]
MATKVLQLPNYPSTQARKGLSPSQLATLYQNVASTLASVIALPPEKRDVSSTRAFLSSFSRDTAFQTLQTLIWNDKEAAIQAPGGDESLILKRCLALAEKLALSSSGLDLQTLLDLSIINGRSHPSRLHSVFKAAHQTDKSLSQSIANDLVPGFTALLSQQTPSSHGLYAQRKVAECIFTFLRGAKGIPELIRPFARDKPFLVALASTYDAGMTSTAASYGGIPALTAGISAQDREPDDWERIWVGTKVAFLDSFHILLTTILDDLASCPPGPRLAAESERTFDIIFAILEAPSSSSSPSTPPTPFLNQSLLADYQNAYSLSKTLATALRHAKEKDVRLDVLESTLQSFEASTQIDKQPTKSKNPGALKILLRSSGIQPGIDNLGNRNQRNVEVASSSQQHPAPAAAELSLPVQGKGKKRAAAPVSDPDLDIKATQVLDILPDTPVGYVKLLLAHDRYGRNPEKVIEALLDGTAMSQDELDHDLDASEGLDYGVGAVPIVDNQKEEVYDVTQRKNVFDDEVIDVSQLRFGKKSATGDDLLKDRTYIEQMKADILRRAEAITDDEEEEEEETPREHDAAKGKGKEKEKEPSKRAVDMGPDDDEDDAVALRVAGDGEDTGDEDEDDEEEEEEQQTPEVILELAYLRDPKVFERDAATRRSKARLDLKAQTGWDDGQIEGWKVMLDRNPTRKEKFKEKHEFRGNEKGLDVRVGASSSSRARGRGRGGGGPRGGRGGARGGGGGGGGASQSGGGGDSSARERAWKDKNKASRGNHNRKRGHDKKMARAGAGVGPPT